MQGWTLAAFGALFAAAVTAVVLGAGAPRPHTGNAPQQKASAAPSAAPAAAPAEPTQAAAKPAPDPQADGDPFDHLPNGKPVPQLPSAAPQSVSFGVIQFPYRGAELAPKGAPSKAEALAQAKKALIKAKKSFEDAVQLGDSGSTADAGRIPRGVLEPAVEYQLFTLAKGETCDQPVDTPRGYWIVRRNK